MKQIKHGYIFVLTLLLISISVILVSYLFNRGTVFVPFMATMVEQEKARILAYGGVQVAMSSLATTLPEQEKKTTQAQNMQEQLNKQLLRTLLPNLNQWQTFTLTQANDGIDGELNICLMAEDGKINLNRIYDFEKKQFLGQGQPKDDMKKIMTAVFKEIEKNIGAKNLFAGFEKFLKERQYIIQDATELLTIPEFAVFKDKVFYTPPTSSTTAQKRPLYLIDIFTTWSTAQSVQPWLLSDSIRGILGLKRVESGHMKDRERTIEQWLKPFKSSWQWPADWKAMFMPIYGKELKNFTNDSTSILGTQFEPHIFSALSYATVGKATQRFFAIIERKQVSQEKDAQFSIALKKLYSI